MGAYDRLLGITQHGLDAGLGIEREIANRPTLADVFMERFRQGGEDRMNRELTQRKLESEMGSAEQDRVARQLKVMTNAAMYTTPESEASWEELQRRAGIENPIMGAGFRAAEPERKDAELAAKLKMKLEEIAARGQAQKDVALETGRNLSTFGKIERERRMGLLPEERHAGAVRKTETVFDPVRTALAGQGLAIVPPGAEKPSVQTIEGGKADVERKTKAAEAKSAFGAASRDVDDLIKKIDEALAHPGLDGATGVTGKLLRVIPSKKEAVAAGLLESIKAQSGLQRISDLKKGGAGLGQVTESEHTLVQNAGNSLDLDKMDAKTLRSNMKQLRSKAMRLRAALQRDMGAKVGALGTDGKGETGGNYEGEISPSGKYVFRGGSWVKRTGGK